MKELESATRDAYIASSVAMTSLQMLERCLDQAVGYVERGLEKVEFQSEVAQHLYATLCGVDQLDSMHNNTKVHDECVLDDDEALGISTGTDDNLSTGMYHIYKVHAYWK